MAAPSLAARLGLHAHRAPNRAGAINAAVATAAGDTIVSLTVPWLVNVRTVGSCLDALENAKEPSVVVPALEMRTADALTRQRLRSQPDLVSLLANPFATPPVFVMRRSTWQMLGCLDENLGDLAWCEWWFRLLASRE